MSSNVRFFTMAGDSYFVGAVALLNSLRLTGHDQELVILDRGLSDPQRRVLEEHATLVRLSPDLARRTLLGKPHFYRYADSGTSVFIDADIVVTASLAPVLELATESICVYSDNLPDSTPRFFPEWESLFQLRAPLRRGTYVNGGFLAIGGEHLRTLGPRWEALCEAIATDRVFGRPDDPLWAGDQEALNALLMSEVNPLAITVLPDREMIFPSNLRAVAIDLRTLAATLEGHPVRMLHYAFSVKPWQRGARFDLDRRDAYVHVLPRLLHGDDLALRLDDGMLPLWLRTDVKGRLARSSAHAVPIARPKVAAAVRSLPEPLRRRLVAAWRRLASRSREVD